MDEDKIKQAMIDEVMDYFDFEKVQKVMEFLDWKWIDAEGPVQVCDLRRQARYLLKEIFERDVHTIGSGGLEVSYINDNLKLIFYVGYWSVDKGEITEDVQSHQNRTTNPHLHQCDIQ